MSRICKDTGHRNWLNKTGEECTCPKYVPASEYDALAAHVEDWREGIRLAKDWHHERDERGYFGCKKEADRFLDWLADRDEGDGPTTSIALHDADLLDRWAGELDRRSEYERDRNLDTARGLGAAAILLRHEADDLRRQTEDTTKGE